MAVRCCNSCQGAHFTETLSLGDVPIAHRFHREKPTEKEFRHPLTVHTCNDCGLIQILDPISPEILYKDYNFCFTSWKTQPQTVPEIALIRECVGTEGLVVEVGSNDGSFLKEMKDSGLKKIIGVEPNSAGCEIARKVGVPIIEGFFNAKIVQQILKDSGLASLVVSRQVVEHIDDLKALMININQVLKSDGWILFEVPDFETPLAHGDPSSLWEEHINYFTEPVLTSLVKRHGFAIRKVDRYPTNGGALMVLAQRSQEADLSISTSEKAQIKAVQLLAADYAKKVERFKNALSQHLDENRAKGGINVLYGTGCRANSVINGLGLEAKFDFLVDDQAEKQGLLMPGCQLEIKSSAAIYEKPGICYLSVNYENEEKVIGRHKKYVEQGGQFFSLNSPSPLFEKVME